MSNILLITKDALCKSYLPVYGNRFWSGKTPNIDALAEKGTTFTACYTAAPSTAMAFLGFCTGKFSYEMKMKSYVPLNEKIGNTIFDDAKELGYAPHIIWDTRWMYLAKPYSECYDSAVIHTVDNLGQPVGSQFPHDGVLEENDEKTEAVYRDLIDTVESILQTEQKVFLWIHIPHVINGRVSYGGDIDAFDHIIGELRRYFRDDEIFISADHGNMNGEKGKICYGFDVYDTAIRIPLITPKIEGCDVWEKPFSSIDFKDLIFQSKIKCRDYIFVDSAYYQQPHRKLAVIHGNYKYIYNKQTKTEELYDTGYDPFESCNLISDELYDVDRHVNSPVRELYFYPHWDDLPAIRKTLREKKNDIWRSETRVQSVYFKFRRFVIRWKKKISIYFKKVRIKKERG